MYIKFLVIFLVLICASRAVKDQETDKYHPQIAKGRVYKVRPNVQASDPVENEEMQKFLDSLDNEDIRHPPIESKTGYSYKSSNPEEENPSFWTNKAQQELEIALGLEKRNTNVAKNVILFLGDGMGVPSITMGRILHGQENGLDGEEATLAMDTFLHSGLSKTYNVDHQVADSAGTATAFLTGVKTDLAVVGINAGVEPGVCSTGKGNEVNSVLKDSHDEGKSAGVVTTTRLNHATPSSAYAHSAYRYWYDDGDLPEEAKINGCKDIAYQLYEHLPEIEVALGGGRRYFKPKGTVDETSTSYNREDGQDLITKWQNNMEDMGRKASYVWRKQEFDQVNVDEVDHLWGMFQPSDMSYDVDRDPADEPSLAEMVDKAIQILRKNENGYFLLVEGGRIDHAHHGSNAFKAIHDVLSFDKAIKQAVDMTSDEDTLIIVTADHSHTATLGGYADRGTPIFGLAPELAADFRAYTTVLYGNGEGFQQSNIGDYTASMERENVTEEMTGKINYEQQSAVPKDSETHGGEDVAIFARGPMAHLFHSVHQQSYIAHVMRYASCVGSNKAHCTNRDTTDVIVTSEPVTFLGYTLKKGDSESALYALFALELVFAICILVGLSFVKKK